MALNEKSVLARNNEMMFTSMDHEIVVLNIARNNYIGLDEIGGRIWELLKTPLQVNELCRQLSQEYEASVERIEAGVLPFLADMESEGMIQDVTPRGDNDNDV